MPFEHAFTVSANRRLLKKRLGLPHDAGMKSVLFGVVLCAVCSAETFYVRPDGGTASQCNGSSNTPYPGSGERLNCAWAHPFWALDEAGSWKIHGGDTLLIESGSYAIGLGAPNTSWCSRDGAFGCVLPPLPSGQNPQSPTRLLGASWNSGCAVAPELWGTQRAATILNLDNTSNAQISCLEITDHSGCVEFHPDPSVACQRDQYPYGDWAVLGIHAQDSRNVLLRNLNIHGLAATGIQAGRITDWTVEDVRIAANGVAGWDGDLGGVDSSNSGTLTFRRWKVEWNGCAETWPGREPNSCWAQEAGGYGDGVGTAASAGRWIIEDSEFSHNTSDGLDLLYLETVRGEQPSVEIRRTIAAGNAGNQIKVTGRSSIVNTVAIGNCLFFVNKPFGRYMGGRNSGDNCRAYGAALALFMNRGDKAYVVNSTLVGHAVFTIECRAAGGAAPSCNGSEAINVQNNVFAGYGDFSEDDEEAAFLWDPNEVTKGRIDYNIIYKFRDFTCEPGTHNVCADPLFINPEMESFDGRLRAGSPAIDTGLPVGAVDGQIPSEDFARAVRPGGSAVDRGAFEYGGATDQPVISALASAASGQPNSLAPGSMMSLYGQRLASGAAGAQAVPLPTRLGDTQVLFGNVPAGLIYVSSTQINLVVPDLAPGANAAVSVLRGSTRSAPLSLPVVAVAPAVFEISVAGEKRGAITNAAGKLILSSSPANPGDSLIAYLTGLGASDPVPGSPGLRTSRVTPRVSVDGRNAAVQFAGPSPGMPGLDQVNFIVPADTSRGREVELWVEQPGRRSNPVSLPVR